MSMTIYPIGHRVQWRPDIPPRAGAQCGTLSRPWHRYDNFPWVIWDGEDTERQCLPECVEPAYLAMPATLKPVAAVSGKNAWDEYRPIKAVRR